MCRFPRSTGRAPTNRHSDVTDPHVMTPPSIRRLLPLIGGVVFVLLATANGAGYRYGVSDQAFYIPAVARSIDPTLFPLDGSLIDAQGRLMFVDEVMAAVAGGTGPVPRHDLSGCLPRRTLRDLGRAGPDRPACV